MIIYDILSVPHYQVSTTVMDLIVENFPKCAVCDIVNSLILIFAQRTGLQSVMMSTNFELKQQQTCTQFALRVSDDLRLKLCVFTRFPELLCAAAVPQTLCLGCTWRWDVSYTSIVIWVETIRIPRSLVQCANRPFGHQRR